MEAVLAPDSTLSLPTGDLEALLGVKLPPAAWTSIPALRAAFPSLRVTVNLRGLVVYVEDDFETLGATRAARDKQRRLAHRAPVVIPSGPAFSLAADDRGATLAEAGYSLGGRAFAQVRSTGLFPRPASIAQRDFTSWTVSAIPTPFLFIAYTDGDHQRPEATARLTAGPTWVSASWTPERYSVDGLLTFGRLSLFASSRNAFALTLNARPVGLQLGRAGKHTTAKLTYGPQLPTPFTPPMIP